MIVGINVTATAIDEITKARVLKGNGSYWGLGVRVVTANDTHNVPAEATVGAERTEHIFG